MFGSLMLIAAVRRLPTLFLSPALRSKDDPAALPVRISSLGIVGLLFSSLSWRPRPAARAQGFFAFVLYSIQCASLSKKTFSPVFGSFAKNGAATGSTGAPQIGQRYSF